MTRNTDTEKIKDKVRKLLNLANDAGAFEGEIDNALRFARRLMLEHNIAEGDLQTSTDPHEAAAKTEYAQADAFTFGENYSLWEAVLADAICKLLGTVNKYRTYDKVEKKTEIGTLEFDERGNPKTSTRLVFYGPAEDARDAAGLFQEWSYIIATMGRLKFGGGCFRGAGRSYCEGFAHGVRKNVNTIRDEEKKEIAFESTGKSLVLKQTSNLMEAKRVHAEKWLRTEQGIKLHHTGGRSNRNDTGAFGTGLSDGMKAGFNHTRTRKIGSGS